jgi:hypothetical protein
MIKNLYNNLFRNNTQDLEEIIESQRIEIETLKYTKEVNKVFYDESFKRISSIQENLDIIKSQVDYQLNTPVKTNRDNKRKTAAKFRKWLLDNYCLLVVNGELLYQCPRTKNKHKFFISIANKVN